ncbi:hypothetical protein WJX81_004041 [Elliptochloris bilobata]|uniref:Uncharacterized protein n=1 Tax=Elliptochloris bilobata TaxID=381761 RepID=A0AAW1S6X0_9CHLO
MQSRRRDLHCRERWCTCSAAEGLSQPGPSSTAGAADAGAPLAEPGPGEVLQAPAEPVGLGGRMKRFFLGDKLDKERLAALGLGAVASYGTVSNITYGGGLAVSWIAFVRQTGMGPLMPGQWKAFLAFYAGFWTVQNFVRPLRFSLAIAIAPLFDRFITWTQNATGWSRRNAFGAFLFLLGTVTSVLVFGSIAVFAGPIAFARS